MPKWTITEAVRYCLKQQEEGLKLGELLDALAVVAEEGLVDLNEVEPGMVLDAVDATEDMDYLIYSHDKYFVYLV